jgi:hypothetical protein
MSAGHDGQSLACLVANLVLLVICKRQCLDIVFKHVTNLKGSRENMFSHKTSSGMS